jgi:phage recombination protein Bet
MSALERQLEASVAYNNERKTQMNALARVPSAAIAPLQFTQEQSQMIRDTYANGASEGEFKVLMEVAKARNLNPLLRQIHFVQRWDSNKGRKVWSAQISIDGIRAIADRTGQYDGQDEPENEYAPDGKLIAVKVRVYRKGIPRPFVGVARWSEYVQTTKEGAPTKFWQTMPHTMLAKCAEALAVRKAFPEDAGGLYVAEEMMQAENDAPQLPRITAHQDDPGFVHVETGAFEELSAKLATLENDLGGCETYDQVLALREMLGSKAKQSQLTKDIQAAGERSELDADQRKALGKVWQRINRQVEKLEASIKAPGVEASFVDADPEQDGR